MMRLLGGLENNPGGQQGDYSNRVLEENKTLSGQAHMLLENIIPEEKGSDYVFLILN